MIFGQGAFYNGANASPEQIQRKREALQSIVSGQSRPLSAAEGIANGATHVVGAIGQRRLDEQARLGRASADAAFGSLWGNAGQSGAQAASGSFGGGPLGGGGFWSLFTGR